MTQNFAIYCSLKIYKAQYCKEHCEKADSGCEDNNEGISTRVSTEKPKEE